jgi:hypothetical protein
VPINLGGIFRHKVCRGAGSYVAMATNRPVGSRVNKVC